MNPSAKVENRFGAHVVAAFAAVLVAALGWRLLVCFETDWSIDSDEAVIGLMAKHIGEGRELPVWYYGQPYMGALEAYLAALPVRWLGTDGVPLRSTALVLALVFVASAFELARRVFGLPAALATGLYLAVPPLVLSVWSLKLRGGYVSLFSLGQLALLLAHAIATRGESRGRVIGLGFVLGLATWLNLLVFPFLASAGLYLLARRKLVVSARSIFLCFLAFGVGSGPFWFANAQSGGETFRYLLRGSGVADTEGLGTALGLHLPQLLGIICPWERELGTPNWRWTIGLAFALALLTFLASQGRSLLRSATFSREATSGSELYALHALAFGACAMLTSFGREESSRYAGVLYVSIAPVFGAAFGLLWAKAALGRVLSTALLAALLAFDAYTVLEHDATEGEPGRAGAFKAFRGSVDLAPLYTKLDLEGVTAVAVDRWTGPRVAYETDERIVALPTRYAPHVDRFRQAERVAWGVFANGKDADFLTPYLSMLDLLSVTTHRFEACGYTFEVFDDAGVPAGTWTVRVATGGDAGDALSAFDRDPRSRWRCGQGNSTLEIDLLRELSLCKLAVWFSEGERPQALRVDVSSDGRSWREVLRTGPTPELATLAMAEGSARFVRITAASRRTGSVSIRELFLFSPD